MKLFKVLFLYLCVLPASFAYGLNGMTDELKTYQKIIVDQKAIDKKAAEKEEIQEQMTELLEKSTEFEIVSSEERTVFKPCPLSYESNRCVLNQLVVKLKKAKSSVVRFEDFNIFVEGKSLSKEGYFNYTEKWQENWGSNALKIKFQSKKDPEMTFIFSKVISKKIDPSIERREVLIFIFLICIAFILPIFLIISFIRSSRGSKK